MKKPEATLGNYSDVYDYYDNRRQNRVITTGVYWLLNTIYHPDVEYAPDAKDQLEACVEEGSGLLVAINHISYKDPQVTGAAVWQSPLRRCIGKIAPLGKDELFQGGRISRAFYDETGGIPVFRANGHNARAVAAAGQRLFDVAAQRIVEGGLVGIYPEGTVNSGDPSRLIKVHSGVGHIACRAFNHVTDDGDRPDVRLLTIGQSLGPDREPRGATVYIGNVTHMQDVPRRLTDAKVPSPTDVTRFVAENLQNSVTMATEAYADKHSSTIIDLKQ